MLEDYPFIFLGHQEKLYAATILFRNLLDEAARSSIKKKFRGKVILNNSLVEKTDLLYCEIDKLTLRFSPTRLWLNLTKKGMERTLTELFSTAEQIINEITKEYSCYFCISKAEKNLSTPWHLWSLAQLETVVIPILSKVILKQKVRTSTIADIVWDLLNLCDFSKYSDASLEDFWKLILASQMYDTHYGGKRIIDQINQNFIPIILQHMSLEKKKSIIGKFSEIQFLENLETVKTACSLDQELHEIVNARIQKIVEKSIPESLSARKKSLLRRAGLWAQVKQATGR